MNIRDFSKLIEEFILLEDVVRAGLSTNAPAMIDACRKAGKTWLQIMSATGLQRHTLSHILGGKTEITAPVFLRLYALWESTTKTFIGRISHVDAGCDAHGFTAPRDGWIWFDEYGKPADHYVYGKRDKAAAAQARYFGELAKRNLQPPKGILWRRNENYI